MYKLVLASFFIAQSLIGLEPPQPIRGQAGLITEQLNTGSGDDLFVLRPPKGWGFSNFSKGNFELFPVNGGFGSTLSIAYYSKPEELQEAMAALQRSFKQVTPLPNGFEVDLPKGWYACTEKNQYLIQQWYMLPKKKASDAGTWKELKHCVVKAEKKATIATLPRSRVPLEPVHNLGWVANHPQGKVSVCFKTGLGIKCQAKPKEEAGTHLLCFSDFLQKGFFYIHWDATPKDFSSTLRRLEKEILAIEPKQKFEKEIILKEDHAILKGHPYGIMTLKGDEFTFTFALRSTNSVASVTNPSQLIKAISWVKHD